MRRTLKEMLAEYGTIALVVYLTIFAVVLAGFWIAIRVGWHAQSAAGAVGSLTAAYVATKLTQPLRIAATIAITPGVAKLYERFRGPKPTTPDDEPRE